jgi:hypothetical protein
MRGDRGHLAILLVLVGLVAVFVVMWLPGHRQRLARSELIEDREATVHRMRAAIEAGKADTAESPGATEGGVSLPRAPDLGPLLQQLAEDLAAESLEIRQLQARAVVSGVDFNRIPVIVQFAGPYAACLRFLARLEVQERIVRIDRIDIASTSTKPGQPLLVDIELSTFCQPGGEGSP